MRNPSRPSRTTSSWEPIAPWYDSWVGRRGTPHHRRLAIPTVLRLAHLREGDRLLDVGCGQGVLARHVLARRAVYTGLDASREMLARARRRHGVDLDLVHADARRASGHPRLSRGRFDVAVFMLSLQDMDPLDDVVRSTAALLAPGARLVAFMTHPCFRVPRGSGWGFDAARGVGYRRIERYLTERRVPMKQHAEVGGDGRGVTLSFHRPLSAYVAAFARYGLLLEALEELLDPLGGDAETAGADDIPKFAAMRARKVA